MSSWPTFKLGFTELEDEKFMSGKGFIDLKVLSDKLLTGFKNVLNDFVFFSWYSSFEDSRFSSPIIFLPPRCALTCSRPVDILVLIFPPCLVGSAEDV